MQCVVRIIFQQLEETCLMRFQHIARRFPHCENRFRDFQNGDRIELERVAFVTIRATCERNDKAKV